MTRSRTSAKQAGARFERVIADWFASRLSDDRIDRRVKTGAKDRGDLSGLRFLGHRVTAELKDYGGRINAAQWIREAEAEAGNDDSRFPVVIIKRRGVGDPAQQYVLMSTETLARFLEGGV
jgi:hypothetical protein